MFEVDAVHLVPGGRYSTSIFSRFDFLSLTYQPCKMPQATDAEHGAELWRTDGTGAGTVLVKDIYPGERSGSPTSLTAFGDYLYFQVLLYGTGAWRQSSGCIGWG